jgi:hypothetical protein
VGDFSESLIAFAEAMAIDGSTGSKQTSKGLFICYLPVLYKNSAGCTNQSFFLSPGARLKDDVKCLRTIQLLFRATFYYALISTSTPEGKSNLLKASTVLEEEV